MKLFNIKYIRFIVLIIIFLVSTNICYAQLEQTALNKIVELETLITQAENNGIVVRKKYFDLNGNKVDLSQIKSGDFVLVHLEMSLDKKYNYLPDAMVIDLLPAGLELENQNLEHALKLDGIKVDGKYVRDWSGHTYLKHSEYRDDRFVAAMALSSYQNSHVFYLARAVTPGEYVIPPALVEDMYRPEIRATSDDLGQVIIK